MRGTKFISLLLSAIIFIGVLFSAVLPFTAQSTSTVLAVNAGDLPLKTPLPGSIGDLPVTEPYKTHIIKADAPASTTESHPNDQYLYDYFMKTVGANPPQNITKPDSADYPWTQWCKKIFDDTYERVGQTNKWYRDFLNGISSGQHATDPSEVRSILEKTYDGAVDGLIPNLVNAWGGVGLLKALAAQQDSSSECSSIHISDLSKELNTRFNNTELETGKELIKPIKFHKVIVENTGDFDGINGTVYPDLQNFYADFSSLFNSVFGATSGIDKITDQPGIVKIDLTILGAVNALDARQTTIVTGNEKPCGDPPSIFLDFIGNINFTICGLVSYMQGLATALLNSAADLLSAAGGIDRGQPRTIPGVVYVNPQSSWFSGQDSSIKKFNVPFQVQMVSPDSGLGRATKLAYDIILRTLNSVLILVMVMIALANILQIQISTYSVRKVLPGIIIGFIAAHFAYFGMRAVLEITDQVSSGIIDVTSVPGITSDAKNTDPNAIKPATGLQLFVDIFSGVRDSAGNNTFVTQVGNQTGIDTGKYVQQFILNFFVIAAAIMMMMLAFLFLVRGVIFTIAVPLAPLAIFSAFFPPLAFIWKRWFKFVSGWIIMPVVASFWIWVAFVLFAAVNGPSAGKLGLLGYLTLYAAGIAFIYMALKSPFSLAGELKGALEKYNALGRSAFNSTVGRTAGFAGGDALMRYKNSVQGKFKDWDKLRTTGPVLQGLGSKTVLGRKVNATPELMGRFIDKTKAFQKTGEETAKLDAHTATSEARRPGLLSKTFGSGWEESIQQDERNRIGNAELDAHDANYVARMREKVLDQVDKSGTGKVFRELEATTEQLKEQTAMLEDVLKEEVKAKKNQLQTEKTFNVQALQDKRDQLKKELESDSLSAEKRMEIKKDLRETKDQIRAEFGRKSIAESADEYRTLKVRKAESTSTANMAGMEREQAFGEYETGLISAPTFHANGKINDDKQRAIRYKSNLANMKLYTEIQERVETDMMKDQVAAQERAFALARTIQEIGEQINYEMKKPPTEARNAKVASMKGELVEWKNKMDKLNSVHKKNPLDEKTFKHYTDFANDIIEASSTKDVETDDERRIRDEKMKESYNKLAGAYGNPTIYKAVEKRNRVAHEKNAGEDSMDDYNNGGHLQLLDGSEESMKTLLKHFSGNSHEFERKEGPKVQALMKGIREGTIESNFTDRFAEIQEAIRVGDLSKVDMTVPKGSDGKSMQDYLSKASAHLQAADHKNGKKEFGEGQMYKVMKDDSPTGYRRGSKQVKSKVMTNLETSEGIVKSAYGLGDLQGKSMTANYSKRTSLAQDPQQEFSFDGPDKAPPADGPIPATPPVPPSGPPVQPTLDLDEEEPDEDEPTP